jgi:predicted dehydrogenase
VVVDKPLARSPDEARSLLAEAEARGLLLSVFHNRRWDGDFLTVRRLVADGSLGSIHCFESRFERWRPVLRGGWREQGDPAEAGGVLFDLGSHLIDQALVLCGEVTGVYAEVHCRRPGARVDDDAFVALSHASGACSHLWMSLASAEPAGRFRVLGSRAAYLKSGSDPQEAALRSGGQPGGEGWGREPAAAWGRLGAGEQWQPVPTEAGDYPAFYRGIRDALRRGGRVPVDPRDALRGLEIIAAARRSAADGSVVQVD